MKSIRKEKIDNRIFLENFRWAEPNKESFFGCIDELRRNYGQIREQCTVDAINVREKFCKQNIKNIYDEIFKEII